MSLLGKVQIGHKAPDFRCDAIIRGTIQEKTLSSYISPSHPSWLILLFIPAAFSFVCPTEVLAFQNCLDEFRDRNCDVVFVSVDTKHSLWHWQNVPRQYGGLGQVDITLLSDASHKMSRDYGVLIEEEGVCLRGLFILDDQAVVQQVTLNNLSVGRSVLEALRLLEAFQAVAKHGVLCPVDWKPETSNIPDTINTISNTLTESYDERLANLQKEFGDTPLTDLDAKHKSTVTSPAVTPRPESANKTSMVMRGMESPLHSTVPLLDNATRKVKDDEEHAQAEEKTTNARPRTPSPKNTSPIQTDCLPRPSLSSTTSNHTVSARASSLTTPTLSTQTQSAVHSPVTPSPFPERSSSVVNKPTSAVKRPSPTLQRPSSFVGTARHSRGHATACFSPHNHPAHHRPKSTHDIRGLHANRNGTHVILEFADPTFTPHGSPKASPLTPPHSPNHHPGGSFMPTLSRNSSTPSSMSPLSLSFSRNSDYVVHSYPLTPHGVPASPRAITPSRMQTTFEAIKKMSSGLASPRVDWKIGSKSGNADGKASGAAKQEVKEEGYFDVVPKAVET